MKIRTHREPEVYKMSFAASMKIFNLSKSFPKEETYSLTDQIRRSSRSVCSNIAEAFRKRRYEKSFISKLNDSEGEAAETQTWLEFSLECNYINRNDYDLLINEYENVLGKLVIMSNQPEKWSI
ncbi:MAG: four helix bundle protein [Ignavibacteria bacterium GWA2_35_9]|nr:MAG: four helix bundle protein [Ignavibacteria bacterium GWA2_35_9]OGU43226.1 MAG: four helix bundle protein [Ignavibacteria bacterium GWB2_36_8]OGU50868.1 MAG: four helix bundle protein [Ignavibacteria bacterium GWC2_36_12]